MDAGTAAIASKPRAQEQALPQQFYQLNFGSTNDLITPNFSMTSQTQSRKASLTSQSAVNKFFRRNKEMPDAQFDEEMGTDIQHLTDSVSFDDITHIRGRGPYGLSGAKTLDTTPIIPTLGSGGPSAAKSNILYRKQMNQQMKMQLANGARAMSLAGSNPMNNDPRTMSMGMQNGPRAMSMGMQNGPRAMSLNNRNMTSPRAMSLRNNQQMYMPRTGSLTNQGMNPMQMQQMPMNNMQMNQMQMNQMQMQQMQMNQMQMNQMPMQQMPMNRMNPMQMQQMQQMQMNGMNPQMNQMNMNQMHMNQMPVNNSQMNSNQRLTPGYAPIDRSSSDSLMNVVEENEELEENEEPQASRKLPPSLDEPDLNEEGADEVNEDDVVYKFDNEDDDNLLLSRKSTLKKSNSMRLRKLNLFNNDADIEEEEQRTPIKSSPVKVSNDTSPSFNINSQEERNRISKSGSDEINKHLYDNQEKFNQLGASAQNQSTATDVYYTANDLNSPAKGLPSPTVRDSLGSKDSANAEVEDDSNRTIEGGFDSDADSEFENDDTLDGRGSPKAISKQQSVRSLTENTAFHNFRLTSKSGLSQVEGVQTKSNDSSVKSDLSTSKDNYQTNPSTANTSSSNIEEHNMIATAIAPINEDSIIENSVSESSPDFQRKMSNGSNKEKRGSRINIFKRLSKSKRASTAEDDDSFYESLSKRNSFSSTPTQSRRNSARRISLTTSNPAPIKFTKEELGIMTANNDLLNELELVTTELASSIRRELKLESQIKNNAPHSTSDTSRLEDEIREKLKVISDLQDKLTKERRLRFISEEHALLSERGQSPSPLKLNYEKTELHRQLILKNDLCNQLQDKLNEYQNREDELFNQQVTAKEDTSLLDKYNELLKENAEMKLNVIPQLEKKVEGLELGSRSLSPPKSPPSPIHRNRNQRVLSLAQNSSFTSFDDNFNEAMEKSPDQLEITSLKNQRDELREVVTKLNSSHGYEMKLAAEKLKSLENKLSEQMMINDKLRERFSTSPTNTAFNTKGGKLQGFSIVSPTKKLFDD